jgi:hypothetical protein
MRPRRGQTEARKQIVLSPFRFNCPLRLLPQAFVHEAPPCGAFERLAVRPDCLGGARVALALCHEARSRGAVELLAVFPTALFAHVSGACAAAEATAKVAIKSPR